MSIVETEVHKPSTKQNCAGCWIIDEYIRGLQKACETAKGCRGIVKISFNCDGEKMGFGGVADAVNWRGKDAPVRFGTLIDMEVCCPEIYNRKLGTYEVERIKF